MATHGVSSSTTSQLSTDARVPGVSPGSIASNTFPESSRSAAAPRRAEEHFEQGALLGFAARVDLVDQLRDERRHGDRVERPALIVHGDDPEVSLMCRAKRRLEST